MHQATFNPKFSAVLITHGEVPHPMFRANSFEEAQALCDAYSAEHGIAIFLTTILTFGFDEEEVEEEVWDEDESPHDPLCSTLHYSPEHCDCGRITREA